MRYQLPNNVSFVSYMHLYLISSDLECCLTLILASPSSNR